MAKFFLLVFMVCIGNLHAKVNSTISRMLPSERRTLALSFKEAGQAYKNSGHFAKSNEYLKFSLDIYPIGDEAHTLANKLQYPLNDDQTYESFIKIGDESFSDSRYQEALANYLMAQEIKSPVELYRKIESAYNKLNDKDNALFYNKLSQVTSKRNSNQNKTEMADVGFLNEIAESDYNKVQN